MFVPTGSTLPTLQTTKDLQGDELLHYDAEIELMNLILLSIPNEIYNSVDAYSTAKEMWKRVERGCVYEVAIYARTKLLTDESFVINERNESFGSHTRVHLSDDEYQQDDDQTNSEDPLASAMLLLAQAITQNFSNPTNNRLRTSSNTRNQAIIQGDMVNIQSRNLGNTGRNTRRAYVQEEVVEGSNAQNETENVQRTLRTSSSGNTSTVQCYNCSGKGHYARNCPKPRVRDSKYFMEQMLLAKQDEAGVLLTDEQNDFLFADASRMEEIEELSANICLMARIQPANNTSDVGPSYDSAFISEVQSSSINKNKEQMYPIHTKIINSTIGDDQIDSNIIFDEPNGNVNSGSVEKDTHVPDLYALEQLARNAYKEAEKQQLFAQKVQQQNTTLTSQLELYKERVWVLENINGDNNYLNEFLEADRKAKHFNQQAQSQFVRDRDIIRDLEKQRDKLDLAVNDYKRKNEELQKTHLILKRQMSENEDRYHDTILDLEAKLKKNVDLILKLGNSLQGMFMLGPKPLSVYDPQLKHGLGYPNPYTLKQAISQCPKLYLASSLSNSEIPLNVRDTEDTLDDASKSQQKMKEKMNDPIAVANKQNCWTIDYKQINALYKDFVPQKELSAEQKYFPSSFIPSDKTPNATSSVPASMPNQVKPIVNELQFYFEFFRKLFQRDIKEMKDVFESTESELCEIKKQNDFLKDQLLEASLRHEVEISVLLNHECVDNSLHAEIEQIKKNSIEIQEGLQAKIKILEKDVQRCQKQSVDFELKLQHEKEKHKWESTLNNKNTNPLDYSWISKMEKLENENVSLEFQLQSLIKERDNVKLEYQKFFDSIKKTRSQSQKEMDELIDHVSEKTYAYGAIRAENQNLLSTISELQTRLKTVEKVSKPVTLQTSPDKQRRANSNKNVIVPRMYKVVTTQESQTNEAKSGLSFTRINAATSVRRPMNKDSHVKNNVLANFKNSAKKVPVYVRKNKQTVKTSANIISNKENVIDVNVANASKAKTLLCVSCMQNVLILCHDKRLANYKLNVHSTARRAFSTNSRTPKSSDTAYVVLKTRFSEKLAQSKSLDTTSVVSKSKIDVGSISTAKHKVSSASKKKKRNLRDNSLSIYMQNKIRTSRIWKKYFESQPNVVWSPVNTTPIVHNKHSNVKPSGSVKKWVFKLPTCPCVGSSCVAGLGHNLFSVRQFCDGDLELAFRFKTCYVRNLEGDNLLTGGRESNLYTISISDMAATSPFKYVKNHLCSACERGKIKKASHPPKLVSSDHSKLELLHMDLCGPMRVNSINGKTYILVIVDDYSRYTWVYFLHSKDKTSDIIKKFIAQTQLNYKAKVCKICTDNGTKFKNVTLKAHYEKLGIMQQFSTTRTPQQNGVVERRSRTLVEAARIMLIFSRLPEFLWAEAVARTCFTQNRSIIHTRHNKTPYELLRGRKPNIEYFHVFGSLCYPTNNQDDLGKMKPKADIGVFIEPVLQRFNNNTSSADTMNTPSKEDLDNLFGLMFEEYFEKRSFDTPINSAAQSTQFHEDSPFTSSIIVENHEAPPIETISNEQTSLISLTDADEFNQKILLILIAIWILFHITLQVMRKLNPLRQL
ncbi:retrovirus-related pol polyprotein from transposon TNT 1-94 [Tanacetum coccineum]